MTAVSHSTQAPFGPLKLGAALIFAVLLGYGLGTADYRAPDGPAYHHAPANLPDWHGNVKSAQP